ncbi:hypothetical protein [Marinobacterium aestuariivivens]|uniref:LysR substrate-binding domain-containing protein n=1 Tax=Marinobacterium aestuariivivens TaxID=1698799 RepID=A0ABW2A9T1_9GAMM
MAEGKLVTPVVEAVELREKQHYLTYAESKVTNEAFCRFRNWMLDCVQGERTAVDTAG